MYANLFNFQRTMDIKNNKIKLSKTYGSYWNLLPSEIQNLIMEYRHGQDLIDEITEANRLWDPFRERGQAPIQVYRDFRELEVLWTSDERSIFKRCIVIGNDREHAKIVGEYEDRYNNNSTQNVFLGNTVRQAMRQVSHVKSFFL